MGIDERGRLSVCPFDYKRTKSGKMMIYYENKMIMTLSEKHALKTYQKLQNANEHEQQLILAKVTGHFKHGNERRR